MKITALLAVLMVMVAICYGGNSGILPTGDNSHWCCKVDIKPIHKLITKTKVQRFEELVRTNITVGYKPCWETFNGIPERSHCPVTKWVTSLVPSYKIVTVKDVAVEVPTCPDDQVYCCDGFVLLMGNCVTKDEAEQLQKLIDAGLIG